MRTLTNKSCTIQNPSCPRTPRTSARTTGWRTSLLTTTTLIGLCFALPVLAEQIIDNGVEDIVDGTDPDATGTGVGTQTSPWTIGDNLIVGDMNTGSLMIQNGGAVTSVGGTLARGSGSTGTVTVTGAGSSWASTGGLNVGDSGTGTLNVVDGGLVTVDTGDGSQTGSGIIEVAKEIGSTGTIIIGAKETDTPPTVGAGTLDAVRVVFGQGTGKLVFNHTTADYLFSPEISGAGSVEFYHGTTIFAGTHTYTGGTSIFGGTLKVTGTLGSDTLRGNVIVDNAGELIIEAAGEVYAVNGYVGNRVGADSSAIVSGTGANWNLSDIFIVGNEGSGNLIVENGGTVTSSSGTVGDLSNSTGAVTIAGADSSWNIGSPISSKLTTPIDDTTDVFLEPFGGFPARLSAPDAPALLGELIIGNFGSGTLTIADGGRVTVISTVGGTLGTVELAKDAASTGTINIGAAAGENAVGAGTLEAAQIIFGAGTGRLVFNHTDTGYTFDPIISGDGSVEVHSGTTIFDGDHTYTGGTMITGGTLRVDGSINSDAIIWVTGKNSILNMANTMTVGGKRCLGSTLISG